VSNPDPGGNRIDGGWMPHTPVYAAMGACGLAEMGALVMGGGNGSGTLNLVAGSGTTNLIAMAIAGVMVLLSILGLVLVARRAGRRAVPDRARSDATRRMLG